MRSSRRHSARCWTRFLARTSARPRSMRRPQTKMLPLFWCGTWLARLHRLMTRCVSFQAGAAPRRQHIHAGAGASCFRRRPVGARFAAAEEQRCFTTTDSASGRRARRTCGASWRRRTVAASAVRVRASSAVRSFRRADSVRGRPANRAVGHSAPPELEPSTQAPVAEVAPPPATKVRALCCICSWLEIRAYAGMAGFGRRTLLCKNAACRHRLETARAARRTESLSECISCSQRSVPCACHLLHS